MGPDMEKRFEQFKARITFKSTGLAPSKFIVVTTAKFNAISAINLAI